MNEKILAFLKTKLNGVPNAFLEGVSIQLASTITEEAQIETVCNAGLIAALKASALYSQQEGDRRATTAADTAIKGYEQKHNLKDGKTIPKEPEEKDVIIPDQLKPIMEKLAALEAKEALASKKAATDKLLSDAAKLAKGKGAENEKLLSKVLKLVTVEDGVTADQISEKILSEYNDFQADLSGSGAVPSIASKTLSDAEIEQRRTAAIAKSATEFKKNATI